MFSAYFSLEFYWSLTEVHNTSFTKRKNVKPLFEVCFHQHENRIIHNKQ